MKKIIYIFFAILTITACKKKDSKTQAQKDEEIITKYISDNKLSAIATGSGLYYTIENQGSGLQPNPTSSVKVEYKGYFTDGNVFDQSSASGVTFNLQQVIKGWTEGIPYFKKGGRGKLLIPSALGYGPNGTQNIPGNTVLIFDIKLLDIY